MLEDRDDSLDAGLAIGWRGRAGELKLRALADVSGASGGYDLSIEYAHAWRLGRTTLIPGIGVHRLSAEMTRYYYGTLDEEEARGVPAYRPGAAWVPEARLGFARPLGARWRLFGALGYRFLPGELADSPWLERDRSGSASFTVGVSRGF